MTRPGKIPEQAGIEPRVSRSGGGRITTWPTRLCVKCFRIYRPTLTVALSYSDSRPLQQRSLDPYSLLPSHKTRQFWADAWCNGYHVCFPSLSPMLECGFECRLGLLFSGFSKWHFTEARHRGYSPGTTVSLSTANRNKGNINATSTLSNSIAELSLRTKWQTGCCT